MELWKKLFSVALMLFLCLVLLPTTAEAAIVDKGTCGLYGDNLTWTINSQGKVTISGNGPMGEFVGQTKPFWEYRNDIKTVVIEAGVTSISHGAFGECENLSAVTIPNSVTAIDDWAFNHCKELKEITLPDGVVTIGEFAFYGCKSVTEVVIPDSVTVVGDSAFGCCCAMTDLTIGSGVTSLGKEQFICCESLTGIWVDANNPSYSSDNMGVLFDKEKTTLIQAPAALLGGYAVPDGVTTIGNMAFRDCTKLTDVTLPDSVVKIDEFAFSDCSALTTVRFGADLTSIDEYAFDYCTAITEVYYNGTREQWKQITIKKGNRNLDYGNWYGATSGTYGENMTWTLSENGTLTISGVGEMCYRSSEWAERWNGHVAKIKKVIIGSGVTTIGDNAFYGCQSLEQMTVPDSVTLIGNSAFCHCDNLTQIVLPASVVTIEPGAFLICYNLQDVYYYGAREQWEAVNIDQGNECLLDATVHFVEKSSGDINIDGFLTTDDAVYLLLHVMFGGGDYPIEGETDMNGDGSVTTDDAVYLLLHIMFGPEDYPLAA